MDRQSLEDALDHDAPLPPERVVPIVERLGAALTDVDGVPRDVRALMATPRYAPPEQGRVPEEAICEQFSLAAIAYHLLTGHPPFADDPVREASPASIRACRPDVSAQLEDVVFRGLARERRERYPSLPDFVSSFRGAAKVRAEGGEGDEATMVSTVPSDLAELLRRDSGRSLFTGAASSAMNDELTVVSSAAAEDEPTVITPSSPSEQPAALPTVLPTAAKVAPVAGTLDVAHTRTFQVRRQGSHRQWSRMPTTRVAVTAGGLVLALGAVVLWRVSASPSPTSTRAPAAASPALAVPVVPLAGPPAEPASPPVPIPSLAPTAPTAASPAPAAPAGRAPPAEPAVALAVAERPARLRARTHASPVPDDNAAADPGHADVPKKCRISVGSYPWSYVWIDGADTGLQTPIVNLALSCGRHRLAFKRKDLKVDQIETVTLSEGTDFKRQYELKGLNLDD